MDASELTRLAIESLYLALLLSAPVLLISLLVGTAIGILQAVTQLHDTSLSFVPKLFAVGLILALFGAWMGQELLRFTHTLWQVFP